jgi:non-ribosomal peptide synthetase component E (peptide arylation enzyme)
VAQVLAFIPDLLFGSNVVGALRAAGHEPVLVSGSEQAERELPSAELLIVDLTADAPERIEALAEVVRSGAVPVLAFYSHVEADVRAQAERAGFDLVVPRSRMAREGGALVDRLLAGRAP